MIKFYKLFILNWHECVAILVTKRERKTFFLFNKKSNKNRRHLPDKKICGKRKIYLGIYGNGFTELLKYKSNYFLYYDNKNLIPMSLCEKVQPKRKCFPSWKQNFKTIWLSLLTTMTIFGNLPENEHSPPRRFYDWWKTTWIWCRVESWRMWKALHRWGRPPSHRSKIKKVIKMNKMKAKTKFFISGGKFT